MYQQENHMYETAELDTEVFRAPNARGFTSLDDMEREREDPELYISTRPFDAGTLRQMVALATQKAAPVREIPAEPSELEQRARDFARAGRLPEARRLVDQAFLLRVTQDDTDGVELLAAVQLRGSLALRAGDLSSALERFVEALDLAEGMVGSSHPMVASCHRNLGAAYRLLGNFDAAVSSLTKSLQIYSACGESEGVGMAMTLCCLGNLDRARGEYGDAIRHYTHARDLIESPVGRGLHRAMASVLHGLGAALVCVGRGREAISVLARAQYIRANTSSTIVQLAGTTLLYGEALWLGHHHLAGYKKVQEAREIYRQHPHPDPERELVFRRWLEEHEV